MIQIEAFQEFRSGLAFLRGGDAHKALPHLRCALDQEPDNPYYISYMGVALAAAEQKWAEAEKLCHSAMRMNRRQAQLYLNLAEVYVAADRKQDAADILAVMDWAQAKLPWLSYGATLDGKDPHEPIMGAIGGVFPARMAAKKEILVALRDI